MADNTVTFYPFADAKIGKIEYVKKFIAILFDFMCFCLIFNKIELC